MIRRASLLRTAVTIAACLPFVPNPALHAAIDPVTCELAPAAAKDEPWCENAEAPATTPTDAEAAEAKKTKKEWKTGKLFVRDAGHILSEPGRWKKKQWGEFGISAAAVLGTAFLDTTIRDAVQRNRGGPVESVVNRLEPFGAEYSFVVIAGFYIGGVSAHDKNARETAVDAIAGTLIASGIITPVLKKVVGRARPSESGGDPTQFDPFSNNASFPSGHTTQAFVVASVIASHYDRPWVQGVGVRDRELGGAGTGHPRPTLGLRRRGRVLDRGFRRKRGRAVQQEGARAGSGAVLDRPPDRARGVRRRVLASF